MRQKDIRTRVAEIEAEAKGSDEIEAEEEDEKISKVVPMVIGLVIAGVCLYMLMAILPELMKELK